MMYVVLVTKCVIGNLSRKAKARLYKLLNSPALDGQQLYISIKMEPLILKVGVALVYRAFKIRVGCGYRGILEGFALFKEFYH